jgi:uncharacterized membrane protein
LYRRGKIVEKIFITLAIFGCGTFFGASAYISLVQHPASIEAGGSVAGRLFAPMYRRAAVMQIALAVVGSAAGLAVWILSGGVLWLVGALLLISVVPITRLFIKPINDVLLSPTNDPETLVTQVLLKRWGSKHWIRTAVSGAALLISLAGI